MSLLSDAMEGCVMMDKTTHPDGYGGIEKIWTEGASFDAAIVFDTSMAARTANVQGVTSMYTITTNKNITLEYHDVIKRLRDGKILRITSDGKDKHTPASASLNMRQVTGEEFTLDG